MADDVLFVPFVNTEHHGCKGPYPLGDFGLIRGTIGRRRPIVLSIVLPVGMAYLLGNWATDR